MMPLHLIHASVGVGVPLTTIIEDNAKLPAEEVLQKACKGRRKQCMSGVGAGGTWSSDVNKPILQNKPSRWDPIPVNTNSPKMITRPRMTLNECARMSSLRMPQRWVDDDNDDDNVSALHQVHTTSMKLPTRTKDYKDAMTILEIALSEAHFGDYDDSQSVDDQDSRAATI
jgi:hypothetical protein